MNSLGNDVVDIKWSPKYGDLYFEKLYSYAFLASEKKMVDGFSLANGAHLLWSIKESCYKSAVKSGIMDRFKPKDFEIVQLAEIKAVVYCIINHNGRQYKSESKTTSAEAIHTISLSIDKDFKKVITRSDVIKSTDYASQSMSVRDMAQGYLSEYYSESVSFSKNERGIPLVEIGGLPTQIDISFSHDQQKVGFALNL